MKKTTLIFLACTALHTSFSLAGVLDPECTAEKAAQSAAAKATVGVGGRCKPAEAAKDTAKNAAGIEDKGVIKKHTDKDGSVVDKAKEKTENTKDAVKKIKD